VEDSGDFIATLVLLGVGLFGLVWYRKQQQVQLAAQLAAQQNSPFGGPPSAGQSIEEAVIGSIPIVGPAANLAQLYVGNKIATNAWLNAHSQIGDTPDKTEAKAGVAGVVIWHGPSDSEVWSGIKKAGNFVASGEIVEPWKW